METVKAGRSEPWYMLDNAEACLAVLRDVEKRMEESAFTEPEPVAATQKLEALDVEAEGQRVLADAEDAAPQMQATEVMPLPVVAPNAEHMDPEILELFIEEAKEEISSSQASPAVVGCFSGRSGNAHHGSSFVPHPQRQWPHGGCGEDW